MGAARSGLSKFLRVIWRSLRHPAAAPALAVALYILVHLMPMYTTIPTIFLGEVRYGGAGFTQVWMRADETGGVVRCADFDTSLGVVHASLETVVRYKGFAFDLVGTLNHTIRVASGWDRGWPPDWSLSQIEQGRGLVADAVLYDGRTQQTAELVRRGDGHTVVVNEPRHFLNGAFLALAGAFVLSCLWLPAHSWRFVRSLGKAAKAP